MATLVTNDNTNEEQTFKMASETNAISKEVSICDVSSTSSAGHTDGLTDTTKDASSVSGRSESSSEIKKKLISKPIVDGKTYTTILYEVIAGIEEPTSIKYFQIDADKPRTRDARFVIECHLNDALYGKGEGSSKKAAKQIASQVALEKLLNERPYLREDVGRVRKGYPSKKKLRTRNRRRIEARPQPTWRRPERQYPPQMVDPMVERARLHQEYNLVNEMVNNIEHLTDYLGYPGMTPFEAGLFTSGMGYLDDEYTPTLMDEFMSQSSSNSSYAVDQSVPSPASLDTLAFMKKMQSMASRHHQRAPTSRTAHLNVQAREFKPQL